MATVPGKQFTKKKKQQHEKRRQFYFQQLDSTTRRSVRLYQMIPAAAINQNGLLQLFALTLAMFSLSLSATLPSNFYLYQGPCAFVVILMVRPFWPDPVVVNIGRRKCTHPFGLF